MKHLFAFLLLYTTIFAINAQNIDLTHFKTLEPRAIGPAGMSGRVTCIDVILDRPENIFIGTASGGVWKSTSGGTDWEPIFDKMPTLSIGSIAINQNNPDEIWAGTGEGNPRNSHNSGIGIFKSIDGGKTWNNMGLENTKLIHRIIIDKQNPNIVYAAALGSAWGPNKERGIFKTTDGGKNWKHILYIDDETGAADFIVDPLNHNKLIAAMWQFGRKPWFFNSGGKSSGLHISYDGGENWKKLTDKEGLPKGELGRMGLAFAPSKPNIIYALIEAKKNALYKSTNGGENWKKVADKNVGNRPFYYADIFVDPQNENRIYNLHSTVTKSEDGGKTFQPLLPFNGFSGVHPDHHAFWVHPNDPLYLIEGNDGGLNISRDGGKTWRFVENLPLAQFYHINYDMETPYHVYGGMQDNGSWIGPAYSWKRGGITNHDWQELWFGDGFDVLPRKDNTRFGYAMSQGGNLAYYDRETGNSKFVRPMHPDGENLRFNWNAALSEIPGETCGVYYGSQFVHKSLDCGDSWEIISPDLTTNDTTKQKQAESGGLTIDATDAENFTSILCITPSEKEEDLIWVGTDDGQLQITRDGGENWTEVSSRLTSCPRGSWIPQIVISNHDPGTAFIIVNNYRRNDWKPYVYKTTNYGSSFQRIADERAVSGHALSIAQDPVEPNLLFLGTDQGLYISFNGGQNWQQWKHGFPAASVRDLKIHPREHDLIIGTFGRAAYILDDIRPLRALAKKGNKLLEKTLVAFETPDAWLASYRSINGMRFIADANFVGQNRNYGAMLSAWILKTEEPKEEEANKQKGKKNKDKKTIEKPEEDADKKEKKDKGDKDKMKIYVLSEMDTIRTFSVKVDTGFNRFYWNLRRDGVNYPNHEEIKKEKDKEKPSGVRVLPGTYKLIYEYQDNKDSTTVKVNADPRLDVSFEKMEITHNAILEYDSMIETLTESFDRLKGAEKTMGLVNSQLVNAPDSIQQQIKDLGVSLQDSISRLKRMYRLPKEVKGYQSSDGTLLQYVWQASRYLYNSEGKPGGNAQNALKLVRKKSEETLDTVNQFFDKDWKDYQKEVEALNYSLFKKLDPLKLK